MPDRETRAARLRELIDACIGSVACDGSTAGACAATLKNAVDDILRDPAPEGPREGEPVKCRNCGNVGVEWLEGRAMCRKCKSYNVGLSALPAGDDAPLRECVVSRIVSKEQQERGQIDVEVATFAQARDLLRREAPEGDLHMRLSVLPERDERTGR